MDQYMALSKKDLVINITLNELYNTHSLILQHIETLVCDPHLFRYFVYAYIDDDTVPNSVTKRQAASANSH